MLSSRFLMYKTIYFELLSVFVPTTTMLGLITGLSYVASPQPSRPLDLFANMIGHATIGITTGLLYPISYPIIGVYVLYKHYTIQHTIK